MMMGAPRFRPPEWATLLPPKAFGEALLSPSCRPTPLPQLPLSFCSSARCERARARRARDCERLKQQQQQQQQRAHVSGLSWIMYVSGGSWGRVSVVVLGPIQRSLGIILGTLGAILASLGLGVYVLGRKSAHWESWSHLRQSWRHLRQSWIGHARIGRLRVAE